MRGITQGVTSEEEEERTGSCAEGQFCTAATPSYPPLSLSLYEVLQVMSLGVVSEMVRWRALTCESRVGGRVVCRVVQT